MPQAAIDLTPEVMAELFNSPTVDSAPTPVQLDTRAVATVVNPNPPISNPPQRTIISSPLTDPDNPNFFFLTSNADAVELTPGSLGNYPGGLLALDNNDFINGSADSERMNGNRGADTLAGGGGNDTLGGGKDFDVIVGGFGNDVLNGETDSDRLYGNEDNDFIRGGKGDDELVGGLGNDTLVGDKGLDRMEGGGGADLFVLRSDTAAPPQIVGSEQGDASGEIDLVPADFILDYNAAEGDAIALRGLTQNDVLLVERFLTIDSGVSGPETTNVTIITEADSGNILGLVKGTSPAQIQFAESGIENGELGIG